ncbi:MAG: 3-dehydroquinate synthase [Microbacteriaceae bacterium]|nr:3-dehydroquinate synthase [Microbacteriaceae bacterium]
MATNLSEVDLGNNSLAVIGNGAFGTLSEYLPESVGRVLIVHQPPLTVQADALKEELLARGFETLLAEVPDAEGSKRVEVASFLWQIMGQANFTRNDLIIGIGGGAVTDLAGFVAATWLRGISTILVPTTVLGMVDASIGGKTGINTNEGKNLVGAFHAPHAVIIDPLLIGDLSKNEILTGFAEVIKYGFIARPAMLDLMENSFEASVTPGTEEFQSLLFDSISVKAEITAEDFRESGRREYLNYGHTLGHAIEFAERYKWRHGAAISVGMVYAATLSNAIGRLSTAELDRTRSILEQFSLPTSYPLGRWNTLLAGMKRDKKSRGDVLRFVVLDGFGSPGILTGPEEHLLYTVWQDVGS